MDKPGEMMVFVRVVEAGGFSAAARQLGLTPSAVSKAVGRIEDRLGVRLFQRTTRSLGLTEEGHAFYERSARILQDIEEAEHAVARISGLASGVLRINAAVAFFTYQVVPLLPEFLERNPLMQVQLTITDRVVDLVEEGADLGIRMGARFESRLVSRLLAETRRILVAAPGYLQRHGAPQGPADLAGHNCLAWTGEQSRLNDWQFTGPNGVIAIRAGGNAEVNNGETLYEMTRAGLGIARISEFRVGADIRAGRLVPLLTDCHLSEPVPIHAVYPHRQHLAPKVRAFVDFLVQKFTPSPPWSTDVSPVGRADAAAPAAVDNRSAKADDDSRQPA
ncbi:MAG: LysR family transcriptional regulator [Rhodospirillales bacterium]|nr:MAG: LysR family transcriptional regulator [Rhodospirillales bacterium]